MSNIPVTTQCSAHDIIVYQLDYREPQKQDVQIPETFECPVCYEHFDIQNRVTNSCSHDLCCACMISYLQVVYKEHASPCCSLCRHPIHVLETPNPRISDKLHDFIEFLRAEHKLTLELYHTAMNQNSTFTALLEVVNRQLEQELTLEDVMENPLDY
jgi:hypothetical protein